MYRDGTEEGNMDGEYSQVQREALDKNTAKDGEITGMYLIDKEGILETRDVNACFINGKPEAIESIYIMKNPEAWDRFMRFMERYGQTNGLVFTKAN